MDGIMIREMKVTDIPAIVAIEEQCFANPWTESAFYQEINENKMAIYLVATIKEEVIAYGGMWQVFDEGHITNIAVNPKNQGKQIGKILGKALIHKAREKGIKKMTLEVRRSNEVAQKLYTLLGFRIDGVRKHYYEDNKEDALIMWNTL
ncbi:ribosomal protein S18-alanine N-acetyltransferase [Serpentinicella sp. ANB-PHB4]|uniref:ribosomal protein S18-alanine N-acetyltransferase n=1 Tax=Serpentinicella sp. ANB-PHB4 TaxID=3074076 RepID=UPI002854A34C|nr:ribosomal protein S18-alanine N-acetyltransferase [Serpentinicella sp. ANB-PHB4]MDR5659810.1 ribosomal protein S18-alanine N-acetyltransferase [Serpentinicella sp. ANB-PHB4]